MASAAIVRIKAENLSVLLFRYVYPMMTRNADNSNDFPVINKPTLENKTQSLTKRGSDPIRNQLELEVDNGHTHVGCVDRDRREVCDRRSFDE